MAKGATWKIFFFSHLACGRRNIVTLYHFRPFVLHTYERPLIIGLSETHSQPKRTSYFSKLWLTGRHLSLPRRFYTLAYLSLTLSVPASQKTIAIRTTDRFAEANNAMYHHVRSWKTWTNGRENPRNKVHSDFRRTTSRTSSSEFQI